MTGSTPRQCGWCAARAALVVGGAGLLGTGCTAIDPLPRPPLAVPAAGQGVPVPVDETPAQAAARLSQEMAERVQSAGAFADGPDARDPFAGAQPLPTERPADGVAWTTPKPSEGHPPPVAPALPAQAAPSGVEPAPADDLNTAVSTAAVSAPLPRSRGGLIDALVDQLAAETGAALPRAVVAAGLSLVGPAEALDPRLVAGLKPLDREAAERVRDLLVRLYTVADTPGTRFDRKTVDTAVAEAFGRQPVSITHAELCRAVEGYGVYEPLNEGDEADRFLAGQGNRAILYVEVEDFVPQKLDDGRREVRLSQELILYKEHDGLAVWHDGPTEVVDVSRNHRRDFFLVDMVEFPARLGPGRYRLKVRVTDPHGDTVDETTLRILMVADRELLRAEL